MNNNDERFLEVAEVLADAVERRLANGRTLADSAITGGSLQGELYRILQSELSTDGPFTFEVARELNILHGNLTNCDGQGMFNLDYALTFTGGNNRFKVEVKEADVTITSSSDSLYQAVMKGRESFLNLQVGKEESYR